VLIRTEDPYLTAQLAIDEAKLRELDAQLAGQQFLDRVAADVIRREIEAVTADRERTRERLDALTIRSSVGGTFALRDQKDPVGRFLRRGEVVGYVIDGEIRTVRVALGQDDIGLMRERIESVELRSVDWDGRTQRADVLREVPGGSFRLPDVVLGTTGGGEIAVEPGDSSGLNTLERVFQFELIVPGSGFRFAGQHVDVMFVHGRASVASQIYRAARQLFLSRFGV
jgi:putative peptide zinc metalloprotease protein